MKKISFSRYDKLIILELLLTQYTKALCEDRLSSYSIWVHNMLTYSYRVSSNSLKDLETKVDKYNSVLFSSKKRHEALEELREVKRNILKEVKGEIADAKDK